MDHCALDQAGSEQLDFPRPRGLCRARPVELLIPQKLTLGPMERLLRAKLLTLPRSTSSPASWLVCRDLLISGFDFTYHRSPEALSEEDRRNLSG